jgi:hypothetical protein
MSSTVVLKKKKKPFSERSDLVSSFSSKLYAFLTASNAA